MKSKNAVPLATSEPHLVPGLRSYLYLTAAVTGAAIMIVEILGAKMLSPFIGTSHFVWTAQIAVTLVALACGYYFGGLFVDRKPRAGRVYGAILIAAIYLSLTVTIREPVAFGCLRYSLPIGSLLASTFLFFVPLCLLAMVGPFFIRVLTSSLLNVGGNVGRLSAISTLGSFAGTILIGYVLIPFLPNSTTMYLTALLLGVTSLTYFLVWGKSVKTTIKAGIGVLVIGAVSFHGSHKNPANNGNVVELFRGNSNFGELQVLQVKDSPRRFYLNDYLTQNTYDTDTKQSASMFTFMLHGLAKVYTEQTANVLCIGMGIGIVPMEFAKEGSQVDVVEINPAVLPVAVKYFDFAPQQVTLSIEDGRQFVNNSRKQYDAIILDAFLGDSCPSHLMTREAFTSMKRILREGGVLVINTFAELEGERSFFGASLEKTLKATFASVKIHAGRNGNTLFVASASSNLHFRREPNLQGVAPGVRSLVEDAYRSLRETDPARGLVLTDDYNPVEFYDALNRERTRRNLVESMRMMQRL